MLKCPPLLLLNILDTVDILVAICNHSISKICSLCLLVTNSSLHSNNILNLNNVYPMNTFTSHIDVSIFFPSPKQTKSTSFLKMLVYRLLPLHLLMYAIFLVLFLLLNHFLHFSSLVDYQILWLLLL